MIAPQTPGACFSFACPRCQSLLEAHSDLTGQTGRCPTCGAAFVVPELDPATRVPRPAELLDREQQHPTPIHAYAASGRQAPQIGHAPDGTLFIECPRCRCRTDVAASRCPACSTPFTMESVALGVGRPGDGLAIIALVLSVCALPLCQLYVLGPLAVLCGLASWFQARTARPPTLAIIAVVLGAVSITLSFVT